MNDPSIFGVSKRWADNLYRGFVAFLIALAGFALAMIADWLGIEWLRTLGGLIVVVGVFGGLCTVAFGFAIFPSEMIAKLKRIQEYYRKKRNPEP